MASRPITLQSGIREFNKDITKYTGMLGGLTADIHTLRSLNPETTNRVLLWAVCMPFEASCCRATLLIWR